MANLCKIVAAAAAFLALPALALEPAATYDGGFGNNSKVELRIGNGGAGQSGLVKGKTTHSPIILSLHTTRHLRGPKHS